jgi:hypothetical protein
MPISWPEVLGRKDEEARKTLASLKMPVLPQRKERVPYRRHRQQDPFRGRISQALTARPYREPVNVPPIDYYQQIVAGVPIQWVSADTATEEQKEKWTPVYRKEPRFVEPQEGAIAGYRQRLSETATPIQEAQYIASDIAALAVGLYAGWQGLRAVKNLTVFRRLPQYKAMKDFVKENPQAKPFMKEAEDAVRTAVKLEQAGQKEQARGIMEQFQNAYSKAMAGKPPIPPTAQPSRAISPYAPVLAPKGSFTGAMAFGGKRAPIPPEGIPPRVPPVTPEVTGKYRIYHYYPEETKKTDHIDIVGKDKALEHYRKSRTAQEIWEIKAGKRGEQINPKTGEYLFPEFATKPSIERVAPTPEVAAPEVTFKAEKTATGDILVIYRDGEPIGNLRQIGKGKAPDVEFRSSLIEKPVRIPFTSLADIEQRTVENIVRQYISPTPEAAPTPITEPLVTPPEVAPEKQVARLAEQVKAKLAAKPPEVKPTPKAPVERRAEIQSLLKEPAKNLPTGTTKIALRKELEEINKTLIPQERKLRQQIMASAKAKSITQAQYRDIFKRIGGHRHLTDIRLEGLQKILPAVQKARPVTIKGRKVIKPKMETQIQERKADLKEKGYLSDKLYQDILSKLKLKVDKYTDPTSFITETEARSILREMDNIETLAPLGELKFGKPTPVKYLTSQTYYAQILGVKPLVEPLELAKQNFDLVFRAMSQAIDGKIAEVNRAWGVGVGERVTAKAKGQPTKGVGQLRDLLDKYEEAPAELTTKQKELFNWFRNLNRTIINGENEVRRALDMPEITYRQAYVRHVPDKMAEEIMMGQHPIPPALEYWSQRLVSKKIFNPMELRRMRDELTEDLSKLFTRDLGEASKAMVFTGLKEINLAQPVKAFSKQMGALADVIPASTRRWVIDYVNQVIKGQQTNFDAELNRLVAENGFGGLVNQVLRPFHLSLGQKPVTAFAQTVGKGTIYSVLALPRPRLARLMIRNTFQRTQELALHGVTPTLTSFLPDTPGIKALKEQSMFLKSYTGVEEWPSDLMGKIARVPLAPYQWTAVLNADRGMSIAYYDYMKLFTNPKYKDLGWASPERTHTEPRGFLYPDEQKLMLSEMEWSAGATQYQYIGMGMPEIFRHKTLAPVTRLQSWWMNHVFRFHREAMHRLLKGETTKGHKIPWSMRANYLKYLLLGGALLTSMGYTSSWLWKTLPHNLSPAGQFVGGLWSYVTAKSDWQRNQAKRDIYNSWKAIVPGALAYDEFEQFWSGEKPLWQMFFYGREEEGPPPRVPTYGIEFPTSLEKFTKDITEDLTEYNVIPSNPDELKFALRSGEVKLSREDYRTAYPDVDAKLFIAGQVGTVKTQAAFNRVLSLVREQNIVPTEISAVKAWQEADQRRKELGLRDTTINLTDRLIMQLLGMTEVTLVPSEQPEPVQPSPSGRVPYRRHRNE